MLNCGPSCWAGTAYTNTGTAVTWRRAKGHIHFVHLYVIAATSGEARVNLWTGTRQAWQSKFWRREISFTIHNPPFRHGCYDVLCIFPICIFPICIYMYISYVYLCIMHENLQVAPVRNSMSPRCRTGMNSMDIHSSSFSFHSQAGCKFLVQHVSGTHPLRCSQACSLK